MNRVLALIFMTMAVLTSCRGTIDPEDDAPEVDIELLPDVETFFADGKSSVTFTVMNGDEDVTSASMIRCVTTGQTLQGNTFVTDKDGVYVFNASFEGSVSPNVQLTAMFASRYERKVCVMEFTGQWCSQCPGGAKILNFLANEIYPGQIHVLAFHNNDEFSLPVEQALASEFNVEVYPYYLTDMRDGGELRGNGCSESIMKSLYETETFCGPSVSCDYDAASGIVDVMAKVISEKTMEYRLAAYVVEDKVVAEQTLGTGMQQDYVHRHVVRKMLSADWAGDRLGEIAAGEEGQKTWSFTLDPSWNPQNVAVAVLAIGPDRQVNNMAAIEIIK